MNILITGALGQIGSELVPHLHRRFPGTRVFATDVRPMSDPAQSALPEWREFSLLDVTDSNALDAFVGSRRISRIYHLAAILSGKGELDPLRAYRVNLDGTVNVLEAARKFAVERVFIPSSIAVFGRDCPRESTPDTTVLQPESVYGITKVAGELLQDYYARRWGLDVRSLRFPGIISHAAEPGGGTTDFAVDIFTAAVRRGSYRCYLRRDTVLPFLYMPDVLEAVDALMSAESETLSRRVYNITGFSASCADFERVIAARVPDFRVSYEEDFRQAIADRWPMSIDDSCARRDWGWAPAFDLETCAADMLFQLNRTASVRTSA